MTTQEGESHHLSFKTRKLRLEDVLTSHLLSCSEQAEEAEGPDMLEKLNALPCCPSPRAAAPTLHVGKAQPGAARP